MKKKHLKKISNNKKGRKNMSKKNNVLSSTTSGKKAGQNKLTLPVDLMTFEENNIPKVVRKTLELLQGNQNCFGPVIQKKICLEYQDGGITYKELGRKYGINPGTISNWMKSHKTGDRNYHMRLAQRERRGKEAMLMNGSAPSAPVHLITKCVVASTVSEEPPREFAIKEGFCVNSEILKFTTSALVDILTGEMCELLERIGVFFAPCQTPASETLTLKSYYQDDDHGRVGVLLNPLPCTVPRGFNWDKLDGMISAFKECLIKHLTLESEAFWI